MLVRSRRPLSGPRLRCPAVARILLVGGGCRGRLLATELVREGHAVRITTRSNAGRGAIEAAGAECWLGTPARLATLRGVLDGVAIACWLLTSARGDAEELLALHRERLQFFLTQLIDTTVRGFVYEVPADASLSGEDAVARLTSQNAIPLQLLRADAADPEAWLGAARLSLHALLERA